MQTIPQILAKELDKPQPYIENVIALLDEGNTIPFIARYRKEQHGSMDDTALRKLEDRLRYLRNLAAQLADRLQYLRNLDQRRSEVSAAIQAQGKLTEELSAAIDSAKTLAEVEDLYRPYKQKRRTRATIAREKGLTPLAELLLAQAKDCPAPEDAAQAYLDPEKGVETVADALQGANDIIAELLSDDADLRKTLRGLLMRQGHLRSLAAKEEDSVYRLYYDFDQPLPKLAGHQILAVNRGEKEGFLSVTVLLDRVAALDKVQRAVVKPGSAASAFVSAACEDAYDRLIYPSLEREARAKLTVRAQTEAINVFAKNLEGLLSARPVRGARVLALDPGYRTGCKVAVMDETGKLLDHGVVYPTKPRHDVAGTKRELARLVKKDGVNTIVIGNGTASRETEEVVSEFIAEQASSLRYTIVNEAGASVYSASELASQEYPDLDVTVRGAMSLGRRLQDPLAELVKIPPQSIGVGQYQHDLDQAELSRTLGHVVEDVVNRVGVDVNTASASLLGYVSGITPSVAKNIVAYREENGAFTDRRQLKKVPKLGPKAYLNAAGFLRISGGKNPLDATSVHPESYEVATAVLERAGVAASELSRGGVPDIERRLGSISALASDLDCGTLTLIDIVNELKKPGRDPRDDAPEVVFSRSALSIDDLEPGMELKGTVRNVVDFGAFVDVGVHQDGLVHVSQISDKFIKHPSEVLKVGDIVRVKVLNVDTAKKRIALTMKGLH